MITSIEAILTAVVYLLGGAFILFIYEAYTHTHQKNLLMLSIGMFILIFGSNFDMLTGLVLSDYIEESTSRILALLIEIPGILIMLYSAIRS
ncbi:hypothetical protein CW696_00180 [ANME-2 cluster archaeon]|nr:hypothetical protein [Methanosarcinales archaeon]RJS74012.1 MAG: hypothetical protein CW696_00180 [ANME-2 cluster archaeon]RLG23230.1 MAG: hypothetical protein DRN77_04955 [Methanosarcinales archaeon]